MPAIELEDYMVRAEECLRLAGACIVKANRQIPHIRCRSLADVGRRGCRQECAAV